MPKKKYIGSLKPEERKDLLAMTTSGKLSARKLNRAHILLQAADGTDDKAIALSLHIGSATVARIRQRFVEGGVQHALTEDHRPGGKRKLDIEWNDKTLKDAHGDSVGLLSIGLDVSERKRAEKALSESEEKYRNLVERANDGICIIQDAIVKFVNPRLAEMWGGAPGTIIGTRFADHINPDELAQVVDRYTRRLAGEEVSPIYETVLRREDGSKLHAEINAGIITYEGKPGDLVTVRDITERKHVEEALAQERSLLRALMDNVPDSIYFKDSESRFVRINQTIAHNVGLSDPAQAIGKTDFDLFSAELARQTYADEQGIMQSGEPTVNKEEKETWPDGHATWVSTTKMPLRDQEGRIVGTFGISRDITERKRAEEQIERQLQRMSALHDIDMAITGATDVRIVLNTVLRHAMIQLGVDAATILLLDANTQILEFAVGHGFHTSALQHTHLRIGTGYAGQAALEGRIIQVPNLKQAPNGLTQSPLLAAEGFVFYCAAPLKSKGHVVGVLEVFHRTPLNADQEWLEFLEAISMQAAIAVDNAQLFDRLQRSNFDLSLAYDATIEGWSRALDLRDKQTEGHTQRVAEMTVRLARVMGVDDAALVHMWRGGLLHDMGKIGIPDSILLKPGQLSDDEWTIMSQHPQIAYDMLSLIAYLRPALDIPYCHHEKWDGTGYPRGLKGEDIPWAARIFAVVDVFDALTSDRPYRVAWPRERALEYVREQAGKHFDPQVVGAFLNAPADE